MVGGPVNNGGIAFRWVRDELAAAETETAKRLGIDPYDVLTRIAERVPPGSEGLIFHPFLTGERAPWWNAGMRASFFGLSAHHRKEHMVRAVLEGVIYSLYSMLPAVEALIGPTQAIKATGGFARSALWRQMMADVFNREVIVPDSFESSCLGAAIVALYALGEVASLEAVASMVGADAPASADPGKCRALREIDPHLPQHTGEACKTSTPASPLSSRESPCCAPTERAAVARRSARLGQEEARRMCHDRRTDLDESHRAHPRAQQGDLRAGYLARLEQARADGPVRGHLSCTNFAHGFAAFGAHDKCVLREAKSRRTSASSPPTTTCCRPISRSSGFPR